MWRKKKTRSTTLLDLFVMAIEEKTRLFNAFFYFLEKQISSKDSYCVAFDPFKFCITFH